MQKLIFVYNANSGIGNTLLDVAHKILSPKTYNCNLCALTFNTFSENKVWKNFRKHATVDMQFFHIDEFEQKYNYTNYTYPVILIKNDKGFEELIASNSIKKLDSVEALIFILKSTL